MRINHAKNGMKGFWSLHAHARTFVRRCVENKAEGRQDLIIPLGPELLPLTMPVVFLEPINAEEALVADAPCTVSQIDSLT